MVYRSDDDVVDVYVDDYFATTVSRSPVHSRDIKTATITEAQIVRKLKADRVAKWTTLAEQVGCCTKSVQRTLAKVGYFGSICRKRSTDPERLVGTRAHNHVSRLIREGKRTRCFPDRTS